MPLAKRVFIAAISALMLLSGLAAKAAGAAPADDLNRVLRQLDATAANFHSTAADFEFDSVETDPVYDKEVQKGTVYYERNGSGFRMAAHINEINGKAVPKTYTYAGGVFKLYEKLTNQVTTFSKLSQYESWFMLGFGASGKDLEQKWEIKYLAPRHWMGSRPRSWKWWPRMRKSGRTFARSRFGGPQPGYQPQAGFRPDRDQLPGSRLLQHQAESALARRCFYDQNGWADAVCEPVKAQRKDLRLHFLTSASAVTVLR